MIFASCSSATAICERRGGSPPLGRPARAGRTFWAVAELVEAAGGEFLGAPGRQISVEEVARMNPEVLIAAWCGAGDRVPLEKIVADRGWHGTLAASTSLVYCVRDEHLNTPATTLLQGLDALAFAIHPEIFDRPKGIRQITNVPSSVAMNLAP